MTTYLACGLPYTPMDPDDTMQVPEGFKLMAINPDLFFPIPSWYYLVWQSAQHHAITPKDAGQVLQNFLPFASREEEQAIVNEVLNFLQTARLLLPLPITELFYPNPALIRLHYAPDSMAHSNPENSLSALSRQFHRRPLENFQQLSLLLPDLLSDPHAYLIDHTSRQEILTDIQTIAPSLVPEEYLQPVPNTTLYRPENCL